jgi:hypothetical protein
MTAAHETHYGEISKCMTEITGYFLSLQYSSEYHVSHITILRTASLPHRTYPKLLGTKGMTLAAMRMMYNIRLKQF